MGGRRGGVGWGGVGWAGAPGGCVMGYTFLGVNSLSSTRVGGLASPGATAPRE